MSSWLLYCHWAASVSNLGQHSDHSSSLLVQSHVEFLAVFITKIYYLKLLASNGSHQAFILLIIHLMIRIIRWL